VPEEWHEASVIVSTHILIDLWT